MILCCPMSIEDEIEELRRRLHCVHSNPPHILEIRENEKISIIGADRPDKAVIIGPGGYIAGNLAKRHQKSLSITAHTDELIRNFRKSESKRLIQIMNVDGDHRRIVKILEDLLDGRPHEKSQITMAVALSGGRDSLASAVLLNNLFHIQGFTVYPSDMILPPHVRDSIDEAVKKLGISHEYIEADFSEIIEKSLGGRIHPCGLCHHVTSDTILQECSARAIPAVAFGELLPTGSQSLRMVGSTLIVNLPAFLALTKKETTDIASAIKEYSSLVLGCPLLKAVHKKYPHMKYATAKRILREVRAGVLEPGEALKYLRSLL